MAYLKDGKVYHVVVGVKRIITIVYEVIPYIFSHDTVKFTALGIGFGRQKSATLRSKARSQVTQAAGRAERVNVPFRTTQQEGPNSEA